MAAFQKDNRKELIVMRGQMEKIKIIQIGLGNLGKGATKYLAQRKGMQIVGALTRQSGLRQDLGEYAGIGRKLGVTITNDAEKLFSETPADIVLDITYSTFDEVYPHLVLPVEHGINVLTVAEEFGNPFVYNPESALKLDKLAKEHGVTVCGAGVSPGFSTDYLVVALTSACGVIRKISTERSTNISAFRGIVHKHFGVETTQEEFRGGVAKGMIVGHTGFRGSALMIAERLGWELDEINESVDPDFDDKGHWRGLVTSCQAIMNGEVVIDMKHTAFIGTHMEEIDRIVIEGPPAGPINLVILPPHLQTIDATANTAINAIPHVINAEPGIITVMDLSLCQCLEKVDARILLK